MRIIEIIKKSNFAKNVSIIAGGAVSVQIIQMLLSPILTRLYSPEEFGILTVYNSILTMLIVIGPLNYHKAIPIADNDEKAMNVLMLSILVLFSLSALIILAIFLGSQPMFTLLNADALFKYRYIIPLGFMLMGLLNIFTHWEYRNKKYKLISRTRIFQVIIGNIIKVILGFLKIGPIGLITGKIVNNSAGVIFFARDYFKKNKLFFDKKELKSVAKRYIKFPLYTTLGEFVYTAGNETPVFFITSLYGSEIVGYYGLAYMIIRLPLGLIGNSIGQVFYSEMAGVGKNNPREIKKKSKKILLSLSLIGLIPLVIILLFGPILFTIVFGSNWQEAGVYAQILSPLVYVSLIVAPVGRLIEIFEKQNIGMVINIIRVILLVGIFILAQVLDMSSYMAVGIYVLVASVIIIATLFLLFRIISNEISKSEKNEN